MSSTLIFTCVILYSLLLFSVVWITSRHADNESYFIGNRSSKWFVVAYGMIGASLSGVTFMSVPGAVFTTQFSYMQVVLGYLIGYAVIGLVLMPVYYRLNLTSIYTYLQQRFGFWSYKTGSFFFILSLPISPYPTRDIPFLIPSVIIPRSVTHFFLFSHDRFLTYIYVSSVHYELFQCIFSNFYFHIDTPLIIYLVLIHGQLFYCIF